MATFSSSKNPANDFVVLKRQRGYIIGVKTYCECGRPCCRKPETGVRPHTNKRVFKEEDDAYDWIESARERFEEQYDQYLEENHDAIVQQEQYEQ